MTDREILKKGIQEGYSKALLEKIKHPLYIVKAGELWSGFVVAAGLKLLVDIKASGAFIIMAGKRWSNFNYTSGLNALEGLTSDESWLFKARTEWPLTAQQIKNIEKKDNGYWAYVDFIKGKITKEEALARSSKNKWKEKINES